MKVAFWNLSGYSGSAGVSFTDPDPLIARDNMLPRLNDSVGNPLTFMHMQSNTCTQTDKHSM